MTREEKITFIIRAVRQIEGVFLPRTFFEDHSEERLDKEVVWYEYLLMK